MSNITLQSGTFGGQQCVSGFVNLFRFIQPPRPGDIIGTIRTTGGNVFNLIQTRAISPSLTSVDGQFATLCGFFVRSGGRLVLDVTIVIPSNVPSTTPPPISTQQLLLLLILILLLSGQFGTTGLGTTGLTGASLTGLLGQLGLGGNVNLTSLLSQLGASSNVNIASLLGQLSGTI